MGIRIVSVANGHVQRLALVGASESLGRRLTSYFAELPKYEVRVLTRSPSEGAELKRRFQAQAYSPNFLSVTSVAAAALEGCDTVINLAGSSAAECIASGGSVFKDEPLIRTIIEASEAAEVRSLVQISSIHVYRDQNKVNLDDPLTQENPYGRNHWKKEQFLLHEARSVNVHIMRLANTFGAFPGVESRDNPLFINALFSRLMAGKPFTIRDVSARRDYIPLTYFENELATLLRDLKSTQPGIRNCYSGRLKSNAAVAFEVIDFLERKFGKSLEYLLELDNSLRCTSLMNDLLINGNIAEPPAAMKAYCHEEFERLYAAYCAA